MSSHDVAFLRIYHLAFPKFHTFLCVCIFIGYLAQARITAASHEFYSAFISLVHAYTHVYELGQHIQILLNPKCELHTMKWDFFRINYFKEGFITQR